MIKKFQGLALVALLAVCTFAFAGNPPAYSISFNDKGGAIVLGDGTKTDSKVDNLSVSIHEPRFDTATGVEAKFCWRDGAQAADGSYRMEQTFTCVKRTIGERTVWVANVEALRTSIVDTGQQMSFYFKATMPTGDPLYTRIALGTVSNGICAVHVDDSLPFRLGVTFTRTDPDGNKSHQIEILPKEGGAKK